MSNKPMLEWTSTPFFDFPLKAFLLSLFLIGFGVGFYYLTVVYWQMPLFYILSIAFLFIEIFPFFIPTSYQIYENKIVAHYGFIKVEKELDAYKCFYADKLGILLSTYSHPSRMDRFRGFSIRFSKSKDEKIELEKFLQKRIGEKF